MKYSMSSILSALLEDVTYANSRELRRRYLREIRCYKRALQELTAGRCCINNCKMAIDLLKRIHINKERILHHEKVMRKCYAMYRAAMPEETHHAKCSDGTTVDITPEGVIAVDLVGAKELLINAHKAVETLTANPGRKAIIQFKSVI